MTNPNDPAFLTIETYPSGSKTIASGLTKREYFAAMAMQGAAADESATPETKRLAIWAVQMADALIAELNKEAK
jgi:hypothetical protein